MSDAIRPGPGRCRTPASDAELIASVADGDERAFALLYRRFERRSVGLALRVCRERMLAEEAVQEAFVKVWRRAALFEPQRGQVRGWIATIVRHEAIDALARRGVAESYDEDAIAAVCEARGGLEEPGVGCEEELRAALLALPGEQSSVIEFVFFGGYDVAEVAALLGSPLGTVKSRMRLGIEKLRAQISACHLDGGCAGWRPL